MALKYVVTSVSDIEKLPLTTCKKLECNWIRSFYNYKKNGSGQWYNVENTPRKFTSAELKRYLKHLMEQFDNFYIICE